MTRASHTKAVETIANALSQTRAAGGARIMMVRGTRNVSLSAEPPSLRSTGLVRYPLVRFAGWVVKTEAAALDAEGVIDFRRRRYMLDFGAYAVLCDEGREWDGASGRRLATLRTEKPTQMSPLWLPDLLDGVRSATEVGVDTVRGASCRHFEVDVDPSHAVGVLSDARPSGSVEPTVDVWVDDVHVRRIHARSRARAETLGGRSFSLELWDFGLAVDQLDWTRLPAFRAVA